MKKVGVINRKVSSLFGLDIVENTPIYLGESNVVHMKAKHSEVYDQYGMDIPLILANPDYVGINQSDGSIEYVKEYCHNGEYVKVAVRIAKTGRHYARSIYILNPRRVINFIKKGTLKKVT